MKYLTQMFTHLSLLLLLGTSLSGPAIANGSFLDDNQNTNANMVNNPVDPFAQAVTEEPEFLPVDDAFIFDFRQQDGHLIVSWVIAEEYYLYRDKVKFAAKGVTLGDFTFPPAETVIDEYFGKSAVYRQFVELKVPLSNITANAEVKIKYQGCADKGLCYPPTKKVMPIIADGANNTTTDTAMTAAGGGNEPPISEQDQLAGQLADEDLLWTLLLFFGLGIGLAFTPCVFPMYPILSGIIAGQCDKKMTLGRGFALSMVYVQGMAITYAGLGLVVASMGMKFQAYFQHPAVLVSLSLLFVLLALSMFGWFELSLPAKWQEKMTNVSNRQKGGTFPGVFAMGVLSGLVASPCTTAPLSGALLYVAQSGDLAIGAITLYILSLGMGVPLLILGTSGGKLLPKAGNWMNAVKTVFGFLLLAVPLLLLERLIDTQYTYTAGAVLAVALCAYLLHIMQQLNPGAGRTAVTLSALILFFGGASTLQQLWITQPVVAQHKEGFIDIKSLAELNEALVDAKAANKPVMIDLYADWCVACKEFEKYTFTDPAVKAEMDKFILLRADVTHNTDTDIELLEAYDVMGLPSLLFFDTNATELSKQRVTGFMDATKFTQHLQQVLRL